MTGVEKQIDRIEIGGVIFYADPRLAARLVQLVDNSSGFAIQEIENQQWPEIVAELLLERLKGRNSNNELTSDDLDHLAKYLERQFGAGTKQNQGGRGVAGLVHPLSLVCTFLL